MNNILNNLKAIEEQFNKFAPALITIFKDVYKEWDKGIHLKLQHKNQKYTVYGTLHNDKQQIIQNYRKYDQSFTASTIICQFYAGTLTMWLWNKPEKEYHIQLYGDNFLFDGVETNFNIKGFGQFNEVDLFTKTSLIKQCLSKIKGLGGKMKATNQTGYQQIKMTFQHKNGNNSTTDIKSIINAYKIVAPFTKSRNGGQAISLKQFRRNIQKSGYSIDCGSYFVIF